MGDTGETEHYEESTKDSPEAMLAPPASKVENPESNPDQSRLIAP